MHPALSGRRSLAVIAATLLVAACESTPSRVVAPSDRPQLAVAGSSTVPVVISQVYGAGGNSGALYRNDYVELYNAGPTTVPLTGWSVQYASATGTGNFGIVNQIVALSGSIESGQYYLVKLATGGAAGDTLPTADVTGNIAMAAGAGKVALVDQATSINCNGSSDPCSPEERAHIIDLVGYGNANFYEGTGAAPTISATLADFRKDGGRTDTDNNAADFQTGTPAPRTTRSNKLPPLSNLVVTISPASPGAQVGSTVNFTATATKGGQPVAITSAVWSSTNTSVATIDPSSGVASALATGSTTIGVEATTAEGNASSSTVLTVSAPPATVTVSPATASISAGTTRQFTATARDAGNAVVTTTYTWESSDTDVATVDANGLATGVAEGTATITATSANGVVGQATLTVTPPAAAGTVASITIGGRSSSDPRLSPTFYDQFFATARDANGAVVATTFTWGTTTPGLITVDQRGNVGALAVGNAVITATSPNGVVGTFNLTIVPAAPSTTASYLGNTEFGDPTDANPSDDFVIRRAQYTTSYNVGRGGPNWVSYNLEPSHFGSSDRCDCFSPEPMLPAGSPVILTTDYTNGGYDRGHLVRSADRTAADYDNATTFYFSNIIPQAGDNNQGPWAVLEDSLGKLAKRGDREVYIITGGAGSLGTIKGEGKVVIPARTWKIAVVVGRDQGVNDVTSLGSVLDIIAVDFPNINGIRGVSWTSYKTSVDAIESLTGYDFLARLPDNIETVLEAQQPGVRSVDMNVQPQTISVSTTAVVNVVLLSNATFDATAVNAADVRLYVNGGTTGVAPITRGTTVNTAVGDLNGDGRPDRQIGFSTSALRAAGFAPGASSLAARPATGATWQATDITPPTVTP